jgi:hypothetical protein
VSVNIDVFFTIQGLKTEGERAAVTALLAEVLETEGLSDEVSVTSGEEDGSQFVRVNSHYPVVFSRFYLWRESFEQTFTHSVNDLVPHAKVVFDWGYPDEA